MRVQSLKRLANYLLAPFDAQVSSRQRVERLESQIEGLKTRQHWLSLLAANPPELETVPRAQVGQDLFALYVNDFKRGGFFVEVGAADGVSLSNTYLLEYSFEWTGILAEPARMWHASLHHRRHCALDDRCVWRQSGQTISFSETSEAECSTVGDYIIEPPDSLPRTPLRSYDVRTVSLADLLVEHQAPALIDYLSIDTEGSEFEILREFDFDRWRFNAITVEHNFVAERRTLIYDLLTRNGYERVHVGASAFDDWYVQM